MFVGNVYVYEMKHDVNTFKYSSPSQPHTYFSLRFAKYSITKESHMT